MVGDIWGAIISVGCCYSPSFLEVASGKGYLFCSLFILLMFINLFRLKEANKKFIHTAHGIEE